MPTYQYACTDGSCGHRFELVQSFTDPAASECPNCSGPVRKVFSAVGVVFKGSGFYRTDSRAGSGAKSSGSHSSSSAGSSSSSSGGSDSAGSAKSDSGSSASTSAGSAAPSAASA